ncbi:hypothetical protein G3436_26910 [Pseudomonas sp. MAFF212427]|uniref:Uncharacterized protein n=1 Tax=Pseudomonas brassicae TaxID=2708063 RepID=A0A6B3P4U0_9PSED|nr:hypothetical protein [Pseudomonas brassicae]
MHACHQDWVDGLVAALELAGLRARVVDTDSFALQRAAGFECGAVLQVEAGHLVLHVLSADGMGWRGEAATATDLPHALAECVDRWCWRSTAPCHPVWCWPGQRPRRAGRVPAASAGPGHPPVRPAPARVGTGLRAGRAVCTLMYALNLLPWREWRRQRGVRQLQGMLLGTALLALVGVVLLDRQANHRLVSQGAANAQWREAIDQLEAPVARMHSLAAQGDALLQQAQVLEALQHAPSPGAQVLGCWPGVCPPGVQLTRLVLEGRPAS